MDKSVAIGIDVGKFTLSCSAPNCKVQDFDNNRAGIGAMLEHCCRCAPPSRLLFVMEASGGYSEFAARTLLELVPTSVAIVPPICISSFIKSRIKRLKNDHADALAIRLFGEKTELKPWLPPSLAQRRLRELLLVLDNIKQTVVRQKCLMEKLTTSPAPESFAVACLATIRAEAEAQRRQLEAEIEAVIASEPQLAADSANMLSIPSVGPALRTVLLALCHRQLHELSQRRLLARCGLAPQENQSGKSAGHTTLNKAGDPRIRRTLYMAAQCAIRPGGILHDYYQRQRQKGKSGKSALMSVMRKLLHLIQAVVKSGTRFDKERYAHAA
jgi:transposase